MDYKGRKLEHWETGNWLKITFVGKVIFSSAAKKPKFCAILARDGGNQALAGITFPKGQLGALAG